MLAIHGYYDGDSIQALEEIEAKPNQRVIITFMDDFIPAASTDHVNSLRGILADYANPALAEKEHLAWEQEVVKKHDYT